MRVLGRRRSALTVAFLLVIVASGLSGQERGREERGDRRNPDRKPSFFQTDIPPYKGNVILGRPTANSITLSVLLRDTATVRVAYGHLDKGLNRRTADFVIKAGEPRESTLAGLETNTPYEYRILEAGSEIPLLPEGGNGSFRTGRKPGDPFSFTVQADSHLDDGTLPELYKVSLANALAGSPDLHVDLGDTFMTGKHGSRESAALQYAAQRYYFGLIGHAVPVFLVLGNHDGEETNRPGASGASGLAVWSCIQRKRFFPNPVPGTFYSGNTEPDANAGMLQNYYAWTWGDALFAVLDPYWTSGPSRGGKDPWSMTVGKTQYDWLARTLGTSKAKYKFVFIHQLTGGLDRSGRGGVEAAGLFEWGGHELGGTNTFSKNRPGWEMPIHELLVRKRVTIVFHGHDHFYARQEKDGVIYQLVPQPSHRNYRSHHADEYGYKEGDFLPSSGHLRVNVRPERIDVDYVRAAFGPEMSRDGLVNGLPAASYFIQPSPTSGAMYHSGANSP